MKRKDFIDPVINELRSTPQQDDFYLHAFYTVAKFGLQLKAKEEKLVENEDWNNTDHREELFQKVEQFLDKQFK